MPTPGSPTIVTSWQERCCVERSKVPIRSGFSSSRPTSGVVVRADDVRSEAGARRERAVERERLRLALHLDRLERLVLEDALGRAEGLLRARDPVDRRSALQARGRVDDVARDDPLALLRARVERDDRLARVDPDPHLQRERRVVLRSARRSPPGCEGRPAPRARRRPRARRALRRPPSPHRR